MDTAGNIYVVGRTRSKAFPVVPATAGGPTDSENGFVTKFDSTLSSPSLSAVIGGSSGDWASSAVFSEGSLVVAGATHSSDFPTTQFTLGGESRRIFVHKYNAGSNTLLWSSAFGGTGYGSSSELTGATVDSFGNVILVGTLLVRLTTLQANTQ